MTSPKAVRRTIRIRWDRSGFVLDKDMRCSSSPLEGPLLGESVLGVMQDPFPTVQEGGLYNNVANHCTATVVVFFYGEPLRTKNERLQTTIAVL